jgi:hypothetical protein
MSFLYGFLSCLFLETVLVVVLIKRGYLSGKYESYNPPKTFRFGTQD